MQDMTIADFAEGESALLVTAIHAGHALRGSLWVQCMLNAGQRLLEEDPFTDRWTFISDNRIVGLRSRFEVDLNRPREKAVYQRPEDAWGLQVWRASLSEDEIAFSLAEFDRFYTRTERMLERMLQRHPVVVVYDLHSYNHQRGGPGLMADPRTDPEINLGTANMDRTVWAPVVEQLMTSLRVPDATGRRWDVQENVKFRGGYFTKWLHTTFGDRVCPIAIEFKKVFMNEWTGVPDALSLAAIKELLACSTDPVMHAAHALRRA